MFPKNYANFYFYLIPIKKQEGAPSLMPVNKKQIATIQLNTAIDLFFQGKIIPSITLAGASEEILGCLCTKTTERNALGKILDIQKANSSLPNKKIIDLLNQVKNELKHADMNSDEVEIEDFDAQLMIQRAVSNYIALNYDATSEITKFINWAKSNPL